MVNTKEFEGLRLHVYRDTMGLHTIGYGHNLDSVHGRKVVSELGLDIMNLLLGEKDLTEDQADAIFNVDMKNAIIDAQSLVPNYAEHPEEVQAVLDDLSFNMGKSKLSEFKQTLQAIIDKDYKRAAAGLENSLWYSEVGNRGKADVAALQEAYNGLT